MAKTIPKESEDNDETMDLPDIEPRMYKRCKSLTSPMKWLAVAERSVSPPLDLLDFEFGRDIINKAYRRSRGLSQASFDAARGQHVAVP